VRGNSATTTFGSTHVGFDVTRPVDYNLTCGFGASRTGDGISPGALFIGPFG
jgi:hypothetical protein